MRTRAIAHVLTLSFIAWCGPERAMCGTVDTSSMEPDALRSLLQKGYASAKGVLDDVRIEYQQQQVLLMDTALFKEVFGREPGGESYTQVGEYMQKHGKERWGFLYIGSSPPVEDVSQRAALIGTKDSSRFKVFDGQCLLDYLPTQKDGYTSVGRATLDVATTGLFHSPESVKYAPVKLFGYDAGLMPDDVLASPHLRIETTPETIGGLLAYKVSAPIQIGKTMFEMTYWLSPERSCLPVKTEVVRNGKFIRRLEVKEFLDLGDGRWVIKSVVQRNFLTKPGEKTSLELVDITYDLRTLELHPEIDEETVFNTSPDRLPAGVDVIDRISGLRYFVGEGPVGDKRISQIIEDTIHSINEVAGAQGVSMSEKTIAPATEGTDDTDRPLFSDAGIVGSLNEKVSSKGRAVTSVIWAAASLGALAASSLLMVTFRRLWRTREGGTR